MSLVYDFSFHLQVAVRIGTPSPAKTMGKQIEGQEKFWAALYGGTDHAIYTFKCIVLFCSVLSVRFTTVPLQVNLYTDMCRMLNRLLFWSKLLPSLPAIADFSHPQRMPSAMTFTCNNKSFAEPTQKNLPFKKTQKNH
jgi:hypothetical protein